MTVRSKLLQWRLDNINVSFHLSPPREETDHFRRRPVPNGRTTSTMASSSKFSSSSGDSAVTSTTSGSDARLVGFEVNVLWDREMRIEHDLRLEWSKRDKNFVESLVSSHACSGEFHQSSVISQDMLLDNKMRRSRS
uniref:Uncharacterized protein n=1 Tax=Steinernema glaseri TaxID=37863 RepID=A0A1I8A912_9BILA